jgi:hypothetical protein
MSLKPISYIDSILTLLYSGERVKITFPSSSLRETFRKKLYARKLEQDVALKDLLGEERKVLKASLPPVYVMDELMELVEAEFWLEPFKARAFPFSIIQKEEIENEPEEIAPRYDELTIKARNNDSTNSSNS